MRTLRGLALVAMLLILPAGARADTPTQVCTVHASVLGANACSLGDLQRDVSVLEIQGSAVGVPISTAVHMHLSLWDDTRPNGIGDDVLTCDGYSHLRTPVARCRAARAWNAPGAFVCWVESVGVARGKCRVYQARD